MNRDEEIQYAILRVLSYFHVFEYPLTIDEIWRYMDTKCSAAEVGAALFYLKDIGAIFFVEGYYCLYKNKALAERRRKGNTLGKQKLKKAARISRWLGTFPFVEAVCVSGSLSKDFAHEESDLDYFIITSADRLWTARNLMHLFRKMTILFGAQKSFCMNYYISAANLEIVPKNLYTAIELATLKPGRVHSGLHEIYEENGWLTLFLPNINIQGKGNLQNDKKSIVTRSMEWLINKAGGDRIEKYFYIATRRRWTKKWHRAGFDVNTCMQSVSPTLNTPVNYPDNKPEQILRKYEVIYADVQLSMKRISGLAATIQARDHYLLN